MNVKNISEEEALTLLIDAAYEYVYAFDKGRGVVAQEVALGTLQEAALAYAQANVPPPKMYANKG